MINLQWHVVIHVTICCFEIQFQIQLNIKEIWFKCWIHFVKWYRQIVSDLLSLKPHQNKTAIIPECETRFYINISYHCFTDFLGVFFDPDTIIRKKTLTFHEIYSFWLLNVVCSCWLYTIMFNCKSFRATTCWWITCQPHKTCCSILIKCGSFSVTTCVLTKHTRIFQSFKLWHSM